MQQLCFKNGTKNTKAWKNWFLNEEVDAKLLPQKMELCIWSSFLSLIFQIQCLCAGGEKNESACVHPSYDWSEVLASWPRRPWGIWCWDLEVDTQANFTRGEKNVLRKHSLKKCCKMEAPMIEGSTSSLSNTWLAFGKRAAISAVSQRLRMSWLPRTTSRHL